MTNEFVTIDETNIPTTGEKKSFGPLEEGAYEATCVAMIVGNGTKYQSEELEKKVRFVFAIEQEDTTRFIRSNWMKVSLWAGEPNPSAMWKLLKAWTRKATPQDLIAEIGAFDLKYFLGKPLQVALNISNDGNWNNITTFMAPRSTQVAIGAQEIPEIFVQGDKRVNIDVKYALMDGCSVMVPSKSAEEVQTPNLPF